MKFKSILISLFIPMIICFFAEVAKADTTWQSIGPFGGKIDTLVIDPTDNQTVFSVSIGLIFKSTNGGASWIAANNGITNTYGSVNVISIAIDPTNNQTVYAGTADGVFKSTDGGASWTAANSGITGISIIAIFVDPTNNQMINAWSLNGVVYKSSNGGTSWTASSIKMTGSYGGSLAIDPVNNQIIFLGTNGSGVFKTTNGGASWTTTNSGLTNADVRSLAINPITRQTIYAGTYGSGVFKSTNGGTSWTTANNGMSNSNILSLAIDPSNTQTIYAGSESGGVFKTTNGGTSWSASNSGMTYTYVRCFAIDQSNSQIVYAVTNGGIFKSTNGGSTWVATNFANVDIGSISSIAIDSTNSQTLYVGTYEGVIVKSTNGGTEWTEPYFGYNRPITSFFIDPTNNQTIYAGTYGESILKSTNGGESWTVVNNLSLDAQITTFSIDPTNNLIINAWSDDGTLFKSYNGGTSWIAASNKVTGSYRSFLAIDPVNIQTIYLGTIGAGIFKTTNGGVSWTTASVGLTNTDVRALAIDPFTRQTIYAGTYGGIFKSTNSGNTWTTASNGLINSNIKSLAIDPTTPQVIYTGTYGGGVFKSTDAGLSWATVNFGMTNLNVSALTIDPTNSQTVYAATDIGVFKSTNGGSLWASVNTDITTAFSVSALVIDPKLSKTIYAGTAAGVFKTINGGASWSVSNNGISQNGVYSFAIAPSDSQTIFAMTGSTSKNIYRVYKTTTGVFKTTNGGELWTVINIKTDYPTSDIYALAIDPTNKQTIFAATGDSVFKTTNGGASWAKANSGMPTAGVQTCFTIVIDPTDSQTFYAGTWTNGVFKSTNGGASWTAVNNGIPISTSGTNMKDVYALAVDPTNGQVVYAGTATGVFKSVNGGALWTAASSGIASTLISAITIDPTNSQTVYAETVYGLFKSTDGGSSWTATNLGMDNKIKLSLSNIAFDPLNSQTAYTGTSKGVFKAVASITPVITAPDATYFNIGAEGIFKISASGWPSPALSLIGNPLSGMTFDPDTGILKFTPMAGSAGTRQLLFSADNGNPPAATRGVTLTILPPASNLLTIGITNPLNNATPTSLASIYGTTSGSGLSKVEIQVSDGVNYLQLNNSLTNNPNSWLTATLTGSSSWSLNTTSVHWVEGLNYTVSIRATWNSSSQKVAITTFRIQPMTSKQGTILSVKSNYENIRAGESTTLIGSLKKSDTTPLAGKTITVITTPPATKAAPVPMPIITNYTTDSNGTFTSDSLNQFAIPGVHMIQTRFDGDETLQASNTSISLPVIAQSGYAIIVVGKKADNSLLDLHTRTATGVYTTLVTKRGFLDGNIINLISDTTTSVSTLDIQNAFSQIKTMYSSAPAPVYLILIGHGDQSGFILGNDDPLTPAELAVWLADFESGINSGTLDAYKRHIIVGTCYSGIFKSLAKAGRVVITSTLADERSLAGMTFYNGNNVGLSGGDYFIDSFFSYLGRGDSFGKAFMYASSAIGPRDPRTGKVPLGLHGEVVDMRAQHPFSDDSNNGNFASTLYLGEGIRVPSGGNPADIISVLPITMLDSSTSQLKLQLSVNDNSQVARAWVEVKTPDSVITGNGTGQVIPSLNLKDLYLSSGLNLISDYRDAIFTVPGKYDIFYYTIDNQTNEISPAAHSVVYKNRQNNTAPLMFSLISPGGKVNADPTDSTFVFKWHESSDLDGLTYTLLVATDDTFSNIVYKEENIPLPATYVLANNLKDPTSVTDQYYCQTGCSWKVQAVDKFGALSESDVLHFDVVLTNGIVNSIVTGTILNSKGELLPSATLEMETGTVQGLISGTSGVYMFDTPITGGTTATTNVTVRATGYKPRSISFSLIGGNVVGTSIYLEPETSYSVIITAGANGTLTGIVSQTVNLGADATAVTAIPNTGYHFVNWTGSQTSTANPLTVTNVTANQNITANFAIGTVVTTDTTSPTLILSTLANGAVTNSPILNISGTVSDSGSGIKNLIINGQTVTINPGGSFSIAVTLVAGANTITTHATDNASNSTTDIRTITLDHTAPLLTITLPADNCVTGKTFVDITGSVDDPNAIIAAKNNKEAVTTASKNGTSFSVTLNLAPGLNTIDISASDQVGNISNAKRSVISDTSAPTLSVTNPAQDISTAQGSITISGTVTDAVTSATISINADGQSYTPVVANDGSFIQALSMPTDKAYAVVVTATDQAGYKATVQRNIIKTAASPTGDINDDGNVDIADALKVLRIVVGLVSVAPDDYSKADVAPLKDGKPAPDGVITIADALVTLKKVVGLENW